MTDSINLSGANFSSVKFVDHRCDLKYADFTGSQLVRAKFVQCRMGLTSFIGTNLTDALFDKSNTAGFRLHNAILVRSHFTAEPFNTIFMNTDLLHSSWTKEVIMNYTFNQRFNRVSNTRFTDGTFSPIDSRQLVLDHGAELGCGQSVDTHLYNEPRPGWRQDTNYDVVSLINANQHGIDLRPVTGQCYFQCPLNKSELEQAINVRNYSLIIDSNQTLFNMSAFFSCPFKSGKAYLEIGFYTDQLTSAEDRLPVKLIFDASIYDSKRFHFLHINGTVPSTTRMIYLSVGAERFLARPNAYCLVDDIGLNLFKREMSSVEN